MKLNFHKRKTYNHIWLSRLRYICLWLFVFIFFIFYRSYLSFYITMIVTLLPFISLVLFLMQQRHMRFTIAFTKNQLFTDEENSIKLSYQGAHLPLALCICRYSYNNMFYDHNEHQECMFYIQHKGSVTKKQSFPHSGQINIQINSIIFMDLLGLWRKNVKQSASANMFVLPRTVVSNSFMEQLQRSIGTEKEAHWKNSGAFSDSYDIREYQQQDSLKHLHQKLSFKLKKPMIRDLARLHQMNVYLYIDTSGKEEEAEQALQLFYHTAMQLLKGVDTIICIWQSITMPHEYAIHSELQLEEALRYILSEPRSDKQLSTMFKEELQYLIRGNHFIQLKGSGEYYET